MDTFKIAHFERDNPGKLFPEYRALTTSEAETVQRELLERFDLDSSTSSARLLDSIAASGQIAPGVNAEGDDFCLVSLLRAEGIEPKSKVYVNWDRYDHIDEFQTSDLSRYFDYVWYPSSDDIDIFDNTLSWILSVRHDGIVSVTKPRP